MSGWSTDLTNLPGWLTIKRDGEPFAELAFPWRKASLRHPSTVATQLAKILEEDATGAPIALPLALTYVALRVVRGETPPDLGLAEMNRLYTEWAGL